MLLGAVLLIQAVVVSAIKCSNNDSYSYGIIVDGGSTGSRMYFYQWDLRVLRYNSNANEVLVDEIPVTYPLQEVTKSSTSQLTTNVGIGQFGDDAQGAADSVKPLVQAAQIEFQNCTEKMKSTPIILYATAGMRVLKANQSLAIIQAIRNLFGGSGFMFQDSYVDVISGNEEATFAWISAQYLSGNLQRIVNGEPVQDYGILDMGGASVQIAFQTNPILESAMRVQIALKDETIYATSFLGYGNDHALSKVLQLLPLQDLNGTKFASFPCFFSDYEENITIGNDTVLVQGSSNFSNCAELAKSILDQQYPCSYELCSIQGKYQPFIEPSKTFYAVSGFFYGVSDLGLPSNSTISEISAKLEEVCSWNWTRVKEVYGSSTKFLSTFCWQPTYGVVLLRDAFQFPVDERRFVFTRNINATSVEWSTGAILYEANLMDFYLQNVTPTSPVICSSPAVSTGGWIAIVLFVGVLSGVATAVIAKRLWHKPVKYQSIQTP